MTNNIETNISISLGKLTEGKLVDRPNRFLALVDLAGQTVRAHVPDPGRLEELLFPGNRVMVRNINAQHHLSDAHKQNEPQQSNRKTQYDLVLAAFDGIWVCIDTRYPNKLFEQGANRRLLPEFKQYTAAHREVALDQVANRLTATGSKIPFQMLNQNTEILPSTEKLSARNVSGAPNASKDKKNKTAGKKTKTPKSRFDFLLEAPGKRPLLVEVKSVSLCVDGLGLFPDAPTVRGTRHLVELTNVSSLGLDACVVFIAQRQDVIKVSAHKQMDPEFAKALDEAGKAGVKILAYRCYVSPERIRLDPQAIPYQ